MRFGARWMVVAAALGAAAGCGGSSDTGGTSTTSAGGTGGTGGTTTSASTGGGGSGGTGGTGGTGGGTVGGPFTSAGAASYEAQTAVAASADGKSVVVSWIGFFADNTSAIGYAISRDAGATFTPPAYVSAPGGRLSSNPVIAADGQGRFFLAWLGFRVDSTGPDEHVYLSRLDVGASAFGAPVPASDDGVSTTRDFDKPSIAVDANDNVLLTWADFTSSAAPVLTFARSPEGATFNRTTIASGNDFGNLAYLCLDAAAGPSAPLHVAHLAIGATIVVHRSADQGKTWTPTPVPATNVVFQNPTCVAHGNDVWVAFASGMAAPSPSMNAPGDAVAVSRSSDGGLGYAAPVSVTGPPGTPRYLFPQLARGATGPLEVVYYAGTEGAPAALTRASSMDGASWSTAKIGDAGTFTLDRTLASWLGDYLGLAAAGGQSFVSFTENTKNKAHIGFLEVPAP